MSFATRPSLALILFVSGAVRAEDQAASSVDEADVPDAEVHSVELPATPPAETAPMQPQPMIGPPSRDLATLRLLSDTSWVQIAAAIEVGAVSVVSHTIQFGQNGTELDYVREGGQDNLFPFMRASLEATLFKHHSFVALYQPLTVETNAVLSRDLRVYDENFTAGTPLHLKYGFDFVRFSYFYDFAPETSEELGIGLSLQLRDADIEFASADGAQLVVNSGLGPVPILKARYRHAFESGWFVGAEADGFWASGRIITGTANDFEGAIADVSLRTGVPVTGFANVFANVRYLGGGARGREEGPEATGDGFANNWLHTAIVSFGAELR